VTRRASEINAIALPFQGEVTSVHPSIVVQVVPNAPGTGVGRARWIFASGIQARYRDRDMTTQFFRGLVAAAIVIFGSIAGSAAALSASLEADGAVSGASIALTAAQRAKIVRAITQDGGAGVPSGHARTLSEPNDPGDSYTHAAPTPPSTDITAGSAVPKTLALTPLPDSIGVEIPAVRRLSYAKVGGRLLLVDPTTNIAIVEIDP
jgi:hypothetical protein